MILSCPNCGTQYVVKDGAIPSAGRQVRCASCKHRWHQDPDGSTAAPVAGEPPPADETVAGDDSFAEGDDSSAEGDDSFAEAALIDPGTGPEAEERAFAEAIVEGDAAGVPLADEPEYAPLEPGDPSGTGPAEELTLAGESERQMPFDSERDDFSPFAASQDDPPRRRSTFLILLVVVLVVAALAAAFSFLAPPSWQARVGLGNGGTSPLAFVKTHVERQPLQSGNQLLTISGRIVNLTSTEQNVPPIQAQLQTRTGKVIYSWNIAPPTPRLAPGESASFNSTKIGVPAGGDAVIITTAPNG